MRARPKFIETRQLPRARSRSIALTDAIIAAAWFNAARGSRTRARVLQIRDELETLGTMLDSLQKIEEGRVQLRARRSLPSPEELAQMRKDAQLRERFRVRHNALNATLSNYAFCPVMAYDLKSGSWRHNMISRKSRGPQIEVPLAGVTVQVDAPSVVNALVRLAASRQRYKLRLCDQCKRVWRVSERRIDRFCSGTCRQMAYAQDPEFGARRREIQRRYRQNQKQREVRTVAASERSNHRVISK
jgi:hypothetical protein